MSTLLERLHAVFEGIPILLTPIPTTEGPSEPRLRTLADHVAALANHREGGVLVLGIDATHPVRGVADPQIGRASCRERV